MSTGKKRDGINSERLSPWFLLFFGGTIASSKRIIAVVIPLFAMTYAKNMGNKNNVLKMRIFSGHLDEKTRNGILFRSISRKSRIASRKEASGENYSSIRWSIFSLCDQILMKTRFARKDRQETSRISFPDVSDWSITGEYHFDRIDNKLHLFWHDQRR